MYDSWSGVARISGTAGANTWWSASVKATVLCDVLVYFPVFASTKVHLLVTAQLVQLWETFLKFVCSGALAEIRSCVNINASQTLPLWRLASRNQCRLSGSGSASEAWRDDALYKYTVILVYFTSPTPPSYPSMSIIDRFIHNRIRKQVYCHS